MDGSNNRLLKARILRLKVACYVIYDNKLYMRGYSMPLLKCVTPSEADYLMREIHEGICGNHIGGQSLAFKALKQGYYWPAMKSDYIEFTKNAIDVSGLHLCQNLI